MDLKDMMDGTGGPWTEERHSSFLNWVEDSFVRQVLAAHCAGNGNADLAASSWRPPLPLDRFVPDSATESTRDRDLGRSARTRRSTTTAPAGEDVAAQSDCAGQSRRSTIAAEDDPENEESDVTSRPRTRKRPLFRCWDNSVAQDQVARAKSDGIMPHENKVAEASRLQDDQQIKEYSG
ncbi:hypothetical protein Cni_G18790 [Canna indica]|uniref:Uncharacterized protein n=1 Tax=Canna indica TaxID=4628 RepID=A0AAQ3QHX3_9LILI|nr:hypothetical protein Cni_G18790 [Canna indica]